MNIKEMLISLLPKYFQKKIESNHIKRLSEEKDSRYMRECYATGRIEEYKLYLKVKKQMEENIIRAQGCIDNGIDVVRWKYLLKRLEQEKELIRPNSPEDIEYREKWADQFAGMIKEDMPKELDLRFHGTSIANTKQIIESGGIFSSVDINDGYRASTDLTGQISVTSADSIERTLIGFADIAAYNRSLPCGCIFTLLPRTNEDKELKKFDAMENVDFRKHPEQLFAIFTTGENIDNVRGWLENSGLNPDLVCTFETFIERVKNEKNKNRGGLDDILYQIDPKVYRKPDDRLIHVDKER